MVETIQGIQKNQFFIAKGGMLEVSQAQVQLG
jgi:hypothetical protein